jgi:tRNA G26 N,N-dimethylase Trm1
MKWNHKADGVFEAMGIDEKQAKKILEKHTKKLNKKVAISEMIEYIQGMAPVDQAVMLSQILSAAESMAHELNGIKQMLETLRSMGMQRPEDKPNDPRKDPDRDSMFG